MFITGDAKNKSNYSGHVYENEMFKKSGIKTNKVKMKAHKAVGFINFYHWAVDIMRAASSRWTKRNLL